MKTRTLFAAAALLALGGCDPQHANNQPNPGEGTRAGDRAAEAAGQVGQGTVRGVQAVGHGLVYGARELGQSLSGTQGNPQAESISQAERQAMQQRANQAAGNFDQAGNAASGSDQPVPPQDRQGEPAPVPQARGGGPMDAGR